MDRQRLQRWLQSPHRTWRFRLDQGVDAYEAVETTDDGLCWFRWSHDVAEGGPRDVETQPYAEFLEQGPRRAIPDDMLEELRAWVAEHAPDGIFQSSS